MDRYSIDKLPFGFATSAWAIALKSALKAHPPVFEGAPFTLALVIPADARKDLERAFNHLKKTEEALADVEMGSEIISERGRRDHADIKVVLRLSKRVLIFLLKEDALPAFIVASADKIVPIVSMDAEMLVEAVKTNHDAVLDHDKAAQMLAYPISNVLSALRPGRAHADVLNRLEAVRWSGMDTNVPLLEELSGYGEAAEWARDLKADLAEWKDGKLAWEDVDAGILLSSAPGLGKTLFSRSLARSCDCAFNASSLAQWQAAGHLGDTLAAMRSTFRLAAEQAPCVLLLDEFDSIGDRSKFSGDHIQYCTEVVAALLECLDGAYRRKGVVVVGACNNPDRIDPALLRPGRLGRHYRLASPDFAARRGILSTHFGGKLNVEELDQVAWKTAGFTGADLAQLARDTRRKVRRGGGSEGWLENALSCLPTEKPIDGELRRRIAIHEAGHVVVGLALDYGALTGVVLMESIGKIGIGGAAHFDGGDRLMTNDYYLTMIAVDLAGMAAERVVFGAHMNGAGGSGGDLHHAADLATTMVALYGMGSSLNYFAAKNPHELEHLRRTTPAVSRQVEVILGAQLANAITIVTNNRPFVEALASILVDKGSVDGETARVMFLSFGGNHGS
ncbi:MULTISPECIES: AAA family ATPase [unclassified Rhizobium]|uniref:AAA family ATPase n=1 Tax=unclassified Rhizobium TaxID=2613769 RepID=UPI001ADC9C41|nr:MULTISPECIES: AAA family ATPase [unclassified Rhizobium]MBO9127944.1 AAA family ATPase [Rhizobium sp. 16-488-2b]MBO9178521.1 AAA family ATPase [Rhizobium sp. 16-488-2a]